MRLLSFARAGQESWGVLAGAEVVDLGARPALETPTLTQALREDGLMGIAMNAVGLPADHGLDGLTLLPPVPGPAAIAYGVPGTEGPARIRVADAPVASGRPLVSRPAAVARWRPGLAAVVGSRSRNVPSALAHEMIGGYGCFAELTDTGAGAGGPAALGPWLVTPDEFLAAGERQLTARINGRTVHRQSLEPLVRGLFGLLADVSARRTLEPGDVLALLTPAPAEGWGVAPGDLCEVDVPRAGTLTNEVAAPAGPQYPGPVGRRTAI